MIIIVIIIIIVFSNGRFTAVVSVSGKGLLLLFALCGWKQMSKRPSKNLDFCPTLEQACQLHRCVVTSRSANDFAVSVDVRRIGCLMPTEEASFSILLLLMGGFFLLMSATVLWPPCFCAMLCVRHQKKGGWYWSLTTGSVPANLIGSHCFSGRCGQLLLGIGSLSHIPKGRETRPHLIT